MTENKNSRDIFIKELPGRAAEPAPLGLFGLAVAALVLSITDLDFASQTAKALMIPWILFFGASAQLIAGIMDFKRNNLFGAIVFTCYALAMFSIALTLIINIFFDVPVDIAHYGYALVGLLAFTMIFTVASTLTNKVLFTILVFVDLALVTLVVHYLGDGGTLLPGIFLMATSILSFYAGGAVLLNGMTGKEILPMGKPIWVPNK